METEFKDIKREGVNFLVNFDGRRHSMTRLSLSCLGHEFFELLVLYSGVYPDDNFEVTPIFSTLPEKPWMLQCDAVLQELSRDIRGSGDDGYEDCCDL